MAEDDEWVDEAAGRLGRLYSLTGGRTSPTNSQLDLATQVMSITSGADRGSLEPEQVQIIELCRQWLSVAEVSAYLNIPLVVAKVQLSDLIDQGLMMIGAPAHTGAPIGRDVLQEILEHLETL